uniref:Glycine-rich protein n=1 Tax=Arabidopsis thaliana TaxID=3702 RepID=Q1PE79_ARATH|nr:glycine-rich protein [Arabidopsis thaliana]
MMPDKFSDILNKRFSLKDLGIDQATRADAGLMFLNKRFSLRSWWSWSLNWDWFWSNRDRLGEEGFR